MRAAPDVREKYGKNDGGEGAGLVGEDARGEHLGHDVAGDGGEQDPVAVVAGGQVQAGQGGGAEQGRVVGGRGAQARPGLGERELGEPGDEFVGVAQQLVHPAGGHRGVPAQLLAGGADDEFAVLAGYQVDVAAADDGPDGPGEEGGVRSRYAQPQHLSLHGAHGRQDLVRHAREPPAQAARGEDDLVGGQFLAVREYGAARPVPYHRQALGEGAVEDHPGPSAGEEERGGEPARVDLVVAVDPQSAAYPGGEHRFEAAALAAAEPFGGESAAGLQGVQFAQVGAVVGVEGDGEGAAGAVADVVAGGLLELGDERGIARGGGEIEAEEGLLAVVEFGDGGEHPGRDPRGAAARVGVDDGGAQPSSRGPPRRDQTDDAAPDHEDVGSARAGRAGRVGTGCADVGRIGTGTGLGCADVGRIGIGLGRVDGGHIDRGRVDIGRTHGRPAPPFAGMTRIRFVRSEAVPASLSARCVRAPASALRPPD